MLQIALYIILGLAALSIIVYFLQEKFIFKPEKLKQDFVYKYDVPFEELFFDVEPGVRINGLHFTAAALRAGQNMPKIFTAINMMWCWLTTVALAKAPASAMKKIC